MMKLDNFINMMTGHFNNKEQFDNMQSVGNHHPMLWPKFLPVDFEQLIC